MSFTPGWNTAEAYETLALCAIMNSNTSDIATPAPVPAPPKLPDHPQGVGVDIPSGWSVAYSPATSVGLRNFWQLWKCVDGRLAIVIQGTQADAPSMLEDVLAALIPASGSITLPGMEAFDYRVASDPRASIHAGFGIGLAALAPDIVAQLNIQCASGPHDVLVTGHSMGAALATLVRSYLHYTDLVTNSEIAYKTYVYAQPKPGNRYYGYDFEQIGCNDQSAFRVTNTLDWVPEMLFSCQSYDDLNVPNPFDPATLAEVKAAMEKKYGKIEGLLKYELLKGVIDLVEVALRIAAKALRTLLGSFMENYVGKQLSGGDLSLPDLVASIDMVGCGAPIILVGTDPPPTGGLMSQHHATNYYRLLLKYFPPE